MIGREHDCPSCRRASRRLVRDQRCRRDRGRRGIRQDDVCQSWYRRSRRRRRSSWLARATAPTKTTAYLAWRRVFLDLLARNDLALRAPGARSSSSGLAVDSAQGRSGRRPSASPLLLARRLSLRTCSDWKRSTTTRRTPSRAGEGRCARPAAQGFASRISEQHADCRRYR